MSAYIDFIKDFPSRCQDVLELAESRAKLKGREVTLTLMAASAGLVIPYERLKPDVGKFIHAFGDNQKYADSSSALQLLMAEKFLTSRLCTEQSVWHAGNIKSVGRHPDDWSELRPMKYMSRDKTVEAVLKTIRIGLAHGNIYTIGDDSAIETLIFIRSHSDDNGEIKSHDFIGTTPKEFLNFVRNWFKFLKDKEISIEEACGAISEDMRDAA